MNKEKTIIQYHQELVDSLDIKVKIDYRQVLRVVVVDLIKKHNATTDHKESFKEALLCYLSEDEFQQHVIDGKKIPL